MRLSYLYNENSYTSLLLARNLQNPAILFASNRLRLLSIKSSKKTKCSMLAKTLLYMHW